MSMAYREAADGMYSADELEELYGPGTALLQQPYLKTLWPILRPSYGESFASWFEARFNLTDSRELPPS